MAPITLQLLRSTACSSVFYIGVWAFSFVSAIGIQDIISSFHTKSVRLKMPLHGRSSPKSGLKIFTLHALFTADNRLKLLHGGRSLHESIMMCTCGIQKITVGYTSRFNMFLALWHKVRSPVFICGIIKECLHSSRSSCIRALLSQLLAWITCSPSHFTLLSVSHCCYRRIHNVLCCACVLVL